MLNLSTKSSFIFVTAGIGCGLTLVSLLWLKKNRNWVLVGHVEKLYLYPLKSAAPVESDSLYFDNMGPKKEHVIDRGFAVANEGSYSIKDQHNFAKICLIKLSSEKKDEHTRITLREESSIDECVFVLPEDFSQEPEERFVSTVVCGGAAASLYDCGDIPATWISQVLKKEEKGLRLVYHYKDSSVRTHSQENLRQFGDTMGSSHLPALSNVAPYHMVTSSSVEELNCQLGGEKTTALNFRPNIVIKTLTNTPYQEDRWVHGLKIGDGGVELDFSLPDDRCMVVNFDQSTGVKDDTILKWLKKNRRVLGWRTHMRMGGPYGIFGHRYGLKEGCQGDVNIGQEVWALL